MYHDTGTFTTTTVIDADKPQSYFEDIIEFKFANKSQTGSLIPQTDYTVSGTRYCVLSGINTNGVLLQIANLTVTEYWYTIIYTKA